jgi:hypothetical protein
MSRACHSLAVHLLTPTLCNPKCNHDIVELRVLLFSAPSVHGFSRMGSTDAR